MFTIILSLATKIGIEVEISSSQQIVLAIETSACDGERKETSIRMFDDSEKTKTNSAISAVMTPSAQEIKDT